MSGFGRACRRLSVSVTMVVAIGVCVVGSAHAAGALSVEPADIDFGAHVAGGYEIRSVQVTNAGPDEVELSDIVLIGDVDPFDFGDGSCTQGELLVADGTCSLELAFAPLGFQPASHEATLVVAGGEEDEPGIAELVGETTGSTPLSVIPSAVNFHPGVLRGEGPESSVLVINQSEIPLSFDAVTASTGFRVVDTSCTDESPGGACSITVGVVLPYGPSDPRHGTLTITTGDYETTIPLLARSNYPPDAFPLFPQGQQGQGWPVEARLADIAKAVPALVRGGPSRWRLAPAFRAGAAGDLSLALFGWKGKRRLWIGSGTQAFDKPGRGRLRFRLNKSGVALLRRPQRTRIKVVARFEPYYDDKMSRQDAEFTVKAPRRRGRLLPSGASATPAARLGWLCGGLGRGRSRGRPR